MQSKQTGPRATQHIRSSTCLRWSLGAAAVGCKAAALCSLVATPNPLITHSSRAAHRGTAAAQPQCSTGWAGCAAAPAQMLLGSQPWQLGCCRNGRAAASGTAWRQEGHDVREQHGGVNDKTVPRQARQARAAADGALLTRSTSKDSPTAPSRQRSNLPEVEQDTRV